MWASKLLVCKSSPEWASLQWLYVIFFACAWLLPNHSQPWKSFLSEGVAGLALIIAAIFLIVKAKKIELTYEPIIIGCFVLVPWAQFFLKILPFSGQAVLGSVYIGAAALAWIVGYNIQKISPTLLGDIVFSAIGIAAIASTGLAFYQWLGLRDPAEMNLWIVISGYAGRAVGNIGQPNQLGTLLTLGIVASFWAAKREKIGTPVMFFAIVYFMLGIALTQSRTAVLEIMVLVISTWVWRRDFRGVLLPIFFMLAWFSLLVVFLNLDVLSHYLGVPSQASLIQRTSSEPRPAQWLMLARGSLNSPWWGYGWNLVMPAELSVESLPDALRGMIFTQAHNFFLDFVIWVGYPLGVGMGVIFVVWFLKVVANKKTQEAKIYLYAVICMLVHAMLEYPLYYAYYLVIFSAFAGAIRQLQAGPTRIYVGKSIATGCVGLISVTFALVLADSFAVEHRYRSLEIKTAGIESRTSLPAPPPIVLMTQMTAMLEVAEEDLSQPISIQKLQKIRAVIDFYPSLRNMLLYTAALGLSGKFHESEVWLEKSCEVFSENKACTAINHRWHSWQQRFLILRSINLRGASSD